MEVETGKLIDGRRWIALAPSFDPGESSAEKLWNSYLSWMTENGFAEDKPLSYNRQLCITTGGLAVLTAKEGEQGE